MGKLLQYSLWFSFLIQFLSDFIFKNSLANICENNIKISRKKYSDTLGTKLRGEKISERMDQ